VPQPDQVVDHLPEALLVRRTDDVHPAGRHPAAHDDDRHLLGQGRQLGRR
jgi:hypothetical protein